MPRAAVRTVLEGNCERLEAGGRDLPTPEHVNESRTLRYSPTPGNRAAMTELEQTIRSDHARWGDPCVERTIFGTTDPKVIAEMVRSFVLEHLGSHVEDCLHYGSSVGTVIGLALGDGRDVLVKAHRQELTLERLQALEDFRCYVVEASSPPGGADRRAANELAAGVLARAQRAPSWVPAGGAIVPNA